MILIKKIILCLAFCVVVFTTSMAQNNAADSVRILFKEIVAMSDGNISSCKKFNDFKTTISQINLDNRSDAIAIAILADSLFLKANKNNSCPLVKPVTRLNLLLHNLKNNNTQDSTTLLHAFLYSKSKFSGFVDVQLNLGVPDHAISIQSFEPYILPESNDSTSVDVYILPGKKYIITVAASGYNSISRQLILNKDTTVTIALSKVDKVPESTNGSPSPIQPKQSYWWISAILLALVLFALVWKILNDKKKNSDFEKNPKHENIENDNKFIKLQESIRQLNEQIRQKDAIIVKYVSETKEYDEQKKNIQPVIQSSNNGKYFLTEIMMTAGPRKKLNVDKDLGEDVCGFLMAGDEVFFWLLDGASDYFDPLVNPETKREYFSSRLLAQSIARKLRSHYAERKMEAFEQTMATAVNDVKTDWLKSINSLPETEKRVLKNNIKDGIQPDCATTVLIACLSLGGELNVYRSGDSKMLVYSSAGGQKAYIDSSLSTKNDKIGPVSFLLGLTPTNEFDIIIRQSKSEIIKLEKIQTIIGFSDGIGKETEKALIKEFPLNTETVRTDIIYELQGTGDDKSLCIIEIKK